MTELKVGDKVSIVDSGVIVDVVGDDTYVVEDSRGVERWFSGGSLKKVREPLPTEIGTIICVEVNGLGLSTVAQRQNSVGYHCWIDISKTDLDGNTYLDEDILEWETLYEPV